MSYGIELRNESVRKRRENRVGNGNGNGIVIDDSVENSQEMVGELLEWKSIERISCEREYFYENSFDINNLPINCKLRNVTNEITSQIQSLPLPIRSSPRTNQFTPLIDSWKCETVIEDVQNSSSRRLISSSSSTSSSSQFHSTSICSNNNSIFVLDSGLCAIHAFSFPFTQQYTVHMSLPLMGGIPASIISVGEQEIALVSLQLGIIQIMDFSELTMREFDKMKVDYSISENGEETSTIGNSKSIVDSIESSPLSLSIDVENLLEMNENSNNSRLNAKRFEIPAAIYENKFGNNTKSGTNNVTYGMEWSSHLMKRRFTDISHLQFSIDSVRKQLLVFNKNTLLMLVIDIETGKLNWYILPTELKNTSIDRIINGNENICFISTANHQLLLFSTDSNSLRVFQLSNIVELDGIVKQINDNCWYSIIKDDKNLMKIDYRKDEKEIELFVASNKEEYDNMILDDSKLNTQIDLLVTERNNSDNCLLGVNSNEIRLWDLKQLRVVNFMNEFLGEEYCEQIISACVMDFNNNSNNNKLLTLTKNGTVEVWECDYQQLMESFQQWTIDKNNNDMNNTDRLLFSIEENSENPTG